MSLYALAQHFHLNLWFCVTMQNLLSDAVVLEKKPQTFKPGHLK